MFFQHNYSKAKELIVLAILKAELAQNASGTNKDTQKARFLKETELLRKKLDSYHDFFIKLPLRIQTRKDYEFGKLSVEESLNAFEKGDVNKANQKLNEGKARISYADAEVNAHLKEYFSRFPKWQKWVASTIATSASVGQGGIPAAKRSAYEEAGEQCQKLGNLEVYTLSEKSNGTTWVDGMFRFELNFRCLRPTDPEFKRQNLQSAPDSIIENRSR